MPGLLAIVALVIAPAEAPAARKAARSPSNSLSIIADNLCPVAATDEITVCALRLERQDVRNLHLYAACLATRSPAAAEAAVRTYAMRGSAAELDALVHGSPRCLPAGRNKVSALLLAGTIAEKLIDRRPPPAGPGAQAVAPARADIVDCLVATDPSDVAALLKSLPASRAERDRLRALVAVPLPACVPAGVRLRTNGPALRAMIALNRHAAIPAAADRRDAVAEVPPLPLAGRPLPGRSTVAIPAAARDIVILPTVSLMATRPSAAGTAIRVRERPDLPRPIDEEEQIARGALPAADPTGTMLGHEGDDDELPAATPD